MKITRFQRNFSRIRHAFIPRQAKAAGGMNATEAKYRREVLAEFGGDYDIIYQPDPLVITKTARREYTADFLVRTASYKTVSERPTYHEVKGSYKLPTHDRARLAWEIAAEQNPGYNFVWAELTRKGWEIELWEMGGRKIFVHLAGDRPGAFNEVQADWRRHKPRTRRTAK